MEGELPCDAGGAGVFSRLAAEVLDLATRVATAPSRAA